MATLKAPSREELKLLGRLSADSVGKEEQILSRIPEWNRLEELKVIPQGAANLFRSIHGISLIEKAKMIKNNADITRNLLVLLSQQVDFFAIQYMLCLYYEVIRDDTSVTDAILHVLKNSFFRPFYQLISSEFDSLVVEKAGFLVATLIARAAPGVVKDEEVSQLVNATVLHQINMRDYGRLDILKNLLKNERYREMIWRVPEAVTLILSNLDASKTSSLYPAVFCSWLITFNSTLLKFFTELVGIEKVCKVLKESKTEKVVRVCIHTLINCLADDNSVEAVIRQDAVQTLTLLEYEKWRDEELYAEIRVGLATLQQKIKQFSNFDRYCRELESGVLCWSFLHSEKYWHENVMQFEENQFVAIKKLVLLLRSNDPITLAVACYDLGEFARLHPTGKQVLQKIKAKETIMMLMSHRERNVSREALLCVQKMMLDKWQEVAGPNAIQH